MPKQVQVTEEGEESPLPIHVPHLPFIFCDREPAENVTAYFSVLKRTSIQKLLRSVVQLLSLRETLATPTNRDGLA
jgi:hypothetical protein